MSRNGSTCSAAGRESSAASATSGPVGVPTTRSPRTAPSRLDEAVGRLARGADELGEPVRAQHLQDRPRGRHRARTARAQHGRVDDGVPGPGGRREVLGVVPLARPVEHHRGALGCVAELVQVRRDRRDPGHGEVPRLVDVAPPRQHPAADARVDVAGDTARGRTRGHLGDRVDGAERVARRADDDERRPLVDHGQHVGGRRRARRRVDRDRRRRRGPGSAPPCGTPGARWSAGRGSAGRARARVGRAPQVAGGLHREHARLGPAGRDGSDGAGVAVQDVARERDESPLERRDRRERRRVEAVDRQEQADRLRGDLVEVRAARVVHVGQHPPAVRRRVGGPQRREVGQDVVGRASGAHERVSFEGTPGASTTASDSG